MRVTRIEPQKKRPGRKNIYIDGEFTIGISDETLLRLGLRTGDPVDTALLKALEQTEELTATRASALRLLAHRARSVREMRDRLKQKGFSEEDIRRVVADLEIAGLLDDSRFARMFVRDQITLRPSGKTVLRQKLNRLGINRAIADEAIAEVLSNAPEEQGAEQTARKYLSSRLKAGTEMVVIRRRLTGFLTRRGYPWDVIKPLLDKLLPDQSE